MRRRVRRFAPTQLIIVFAPLFRIEQGCDDGVQAAHLCFGKLLQTRVPMLVGMHEFYQPSMRFADFLFVRVRSYSEFLVIVHRNSSV